MAVVSGDKNYVKLAKLFDHVSFIFATVDTVKIILDSGFDVNYALPRDFYKTDWVGYTILHLIVEKGCMDSRNPIIKLLGSYGANFLQKNNKGFTPLRLAYEINKDYKTKLSAHAKTLINRLLLLHIEFKNPGNPRCKAGISHLHIATLAGNVRVVKYFLQNGIAVDEVINADSTVYPGCTSLHLAMFNEDDTMVHLLLDHGADSTRLNAKGLSPLHLIGAKQLEDSMFIGSNQQRERRVRKNDGILSALSVPRADNPNPVDCMGLSYLHVYCMRRYNFSTVGWKALLDTSVDLDAPVNPDSLFCPGYTALHFAVCCNLTTTLLLLGKGANPFVKDASGSTPLDYCFDKYELSDIFKIFKAQDALKSIQLRNKSSLIDAFTALQTIENLEDYLKSTDANTATISLDSPLWPGSTMLHLAVNVTKRTEKHVHKVETCLQNGVDLTVQNADRTSALHLAFHAKKKKCVEAILNAHLDWPANPVDSNGLSHFHIACAANNTQVVRMLLSNGVDPNSPLTKDTVMHDTQYHWGTKKQEYPVFRAGSTPLHIAAIAHSKDLVKVLLENGADPYLLDANGFTWMHRLFGREPGHFDKLLSISKVLRSNPVTPTGLSHLHVVAKAGNARAVKALLPLTANVNEPAKSNTLLHLAASSGCEETVDLLLKNGADIRVKNAKGLNPLQAVLHTIDHRCQSFSPKVNVIKRLTMDYDEKKIWPDDIGLTRLHVACALRNKSMIERLLEAGERFDSQIRMDSPLWPGYTPLHAFIGEHGDHYPKDDPTVKLLLRHVIRDIERATTHDQPLHGLAKRRKKTRKSTNYKFIANSEGLSALHISCMISDPDIVENFIRLGVDFDVPKDYFASDDAGFFPLHFAVKYSSNSVVELLLRHKININQMNARGNTPAHMSAWTYASKLHVFLKTNQFNGGMQRNLFRKTVVDLLLDNYQATSDDFMRLLENDLTKDMEISVKMRLITRLVQRFKGQEFKSLIEKIHDISEVDANGRNIIYHITFSHSYLFDSTFEEIIENIELLDNNGCDVDLQDKEGRTPLHHAVLEGNWNKVKALLVIGADINVIDNRGHTPYSYCFDEDYYDVSSRASMLLMECMYKLKAAGLYINSVNGNFVREDSRSYGELKDLSRMEKVLIAKSCTLRDFLKEDMVVRFPVMPKSQQRAIIEYLDSNGVTKDFKHWLPVFRMQRKRVLKRDLLHGNAINFLPQILDSRLPDHCLEFILVRLSNEDLHNLIATDSS